MKRLGRGAWLGLLTLAIGVLFAGLSVLALAGFIVCLFLIWGVWLFAMPMLLWRNWREAMQR